MTGSSKPAAKPGQPAPGNCLQTDAVIVSASRIHGFGAFARKPMQKGQRVIEYVGERIDKAESLRRCEASNQYIFTLTEELDLDGNVPWNPARFINHCCSPNCESEVDQEHIWIIARRDIAAGEELTFNYGYDLSEYKDYPCMCGSPECVGYIVAEEFFDHVRRQNMLRRISGSAATLANQ